MEIPEQTRSATSLTEQESTLRDLRKAHALTQERLAEVLHISQDGISRLETRGDLLLSTLRSYIEALGGRLTLVAEFPDHRPIAVRIGNTHHAAKRAD